MFEAHTEKIESSPLFTRDLYLTSLFFLDHLQFIYCSTQHHTLTTFVVEGKESK